MVSTPGFEPGPHWWEVSAVTIGPPLLRRVQFLKGGLVLIQDKNFVPFLYFTFLCIA